jgi:uncharacterized protein with GYD domain
MPLYIMFSNLTDEGRKTVTTNPERIEEVNREIENMGAYVIAQYLCLGNPDFINLIEAPDNEAIMSVSMELASRGTVQIMTLPVIPIHEFIENIRHAGEADEEESTSGKAESADK